MKINTHKIKKVIIGRIKNESPQNLQLNDIEIERVSVFKILGLHVKDNLTWGDHVTPICCKSAKRSHFLKLLKRAEMSPKDLLHYFESVIRPVMHACVV